MADSASEPRVQDSNKIAVSDFKAPTGGTTCPGGFTVVSALAVVVLRLYIYIYTHSHTQTDIYIYTYTYTHGERASSPVPSPGERKMKQSRKTCKSNLHG